MHSDKEQAAQDFLAQVRQKPDPIERLKALENSELCEEAAVKAAIAWWEARYHFVDRKKTRTSDKYLWFLLSLKSWASNAPTTRSKQVVADYKEAFLSPEIERAMALEPRIEEEMHSACVLYLGTIDPNPGFLGFKGKALKHEDILKRIATVVSRDLIAWVYTACAQLDHADTLVRCLWKSAEEVYPGIAAIIEANVRSYDNEQMREFALRSIS